MNKKRITGALLALCLGTMVALAQPSADEMRMKQYIDDLM